MESLPHWHIGFKLANRPFRFHCIPLPTTTQTFIACLRLYSIQKASPRYTAGEKWME